MSTDPVALVSAADVDAAADVLAGTVPVTPLEDSLRLSARHGLRVVLKREDLQPVRSYKSRGGYHFLARLTPEERERGVVCASAGNHAQGVAFACAALGVSARVYLPRTTPRQKRDRVAGLGGEHVTVVVEGDSFDDAARAARRHAEATHRVLVPPFDHPATVAGQGTVVREAVAQLGAVPDVVVVPVGGGGLLAGTVAWLGERHPGVRVVGVEPAGAASLTAALAAGHPVELPEVDPFVDGAAVRRVGDVTYRQVSASGAAVVSVPEGQVCTEMLALYQSDGIIAEPAGALATAALPALLPTLSLGPDAVVLCVLSGGNNDVSRYAEILERSLVHTGLKHYFLVDFPQEPGALRAFLDETLGPDDDITLFEYVKRNNRETGPALVGVELGDAADLAGLLTRMSASPSRIEHLPPDSPLTRWLT
ncbi:threonine ammonia-lyase IlvA [Nocardioides aurantiacus]|uniref:L-threonine dehydratase n=1 Tax=Nocardioides aurantiacus TaxID=86796 RepID=A0A3N2D027_9ACTN|nr:threonine ammonia-lyase IlvA [Nocardioides aurantiacus]ROR93008.1 L-threonine ammonia-lyase [Nocardioides aurantiacus]